MVNRLKNHRGTEIPIELEDHIRGFNLKTNYIYLTDDHTELVSDVFTIQKSGQQIQQNTLRYFTIPLTHEKSILAIHYHNPAGEGITSYAECHPAEISACLEAMNPQHTLADIVDALNIPVANPIMLTKNKCFRLEPKEIRGVLDKV